MYEYYAGILLMLIAQSASIAFLNHTVITALKPVTRA